MGKLLNADELARYAGVHKSTVLLALRRGELRATPTGGRSSGISIQDAREYLRSRDVAIPPELTVDDARPRIGVLTESLEVVALVRRALDPSVELIGGTDVKASLVEIGAHRVVGIVLDLDVTFMNPIAMVRSLRGSESQKHAPVGVIGLRDESFSAARSAGAEGFFLKVHQKLLAEWLRGVVAGEKPHAGP